MTGKLPYGRQWIDDEDVAAVVRALRSDFLTTGPETEAFERALAEVCGASYAVAVANGTAALHCAYAAAGVEPGVEVVTTPLTFSATSNMIVALGGIPIFADIEDKTLCLDVRKAEAAISDATRVIAAVDFAGHPADLDGLLELANRRKLILVEDAAHAIGSRHRGRPVGSLAHLTTFSFHPVKTITTGEGGAVVTDDPVLAQRVRDFRNHGLVREHKRLSVAPTPPWYYEIQSLGFNYRITDLQCALGRSQLSKLGRFVDRRRRIVERYRAGLAGVTSLQLPVEAEWADSAWHLFAVRVRGGRAKRDALQAGLFARGIGTQVHYIAVNSFPYYRRLGHDPARTPIASRISNEILSLPLYPAMSDDDIDRVVAGVRAVMLELT